MSDVHDPPERPCQHCDALMGADEAFASWGDEPHGLQVICYECAECGHVIGYFREFGIPENDWPSVEFRCRDRAEYERLYGEKMRQSVQLIDEGDWITVPEETYERLHEDGLFGRDDVITATTDRTGTDHTIQRGETVALPMEVFRTLWEAASIQQDREDIEEAWMIRHNIRWIPRSEAALSHYQGEVDDA